VTTATPTLHYEVPVTTASPALLVPVTTVSSFPHDIIPVTTPKPAHMHYYNEKVPNHPALTPALLPVDETIRPGVNVNILSSLSLTLWAKS
jgi:hypothetical protein